MGKRYIFILEMIKIDSLKSALETLKSGYSSMETYKNSDISEMLEDSCAKRFEYTLETSVKLMKRFLKQIYSINERDLTVNNTFRLMEGYGFITSWESWRKYYQYRNETSHEYNLNKSRNVIEVLPLFIKDAEIFVSKLSKMKQDE